MVGVMIGPEVQAGHGTGQSASVAMALPAAGPAGPAGPARASGASGTALPPDAGETAASPKPAAGAPDVSGAVPVFDPTLPVTVGLGDSITIQSGSWFRQICASAVVVQNCLNAGIRGNTTAQMLARMDSDVLAHQPAIMILMGGTNDLKHRMSTKKTLRRLDTMIDQATEAGAVAVLCTIPPRNRYGKKVLALNTAIRKYAAKTDVPLLDFYGLLGTKTGIFKRGLTRDGVHPNRRAADRMAALAEERLPGLLHPIKVSPLSGEFPNG